MQTIKDALMDHHDRIVRLENNAELTAEKAKVAALGAVQAGMYQLQKDVATMDARLQQVDAPPAIKFSKPLEDRSNS
jgi:hypothetical protein